MYLGWIGLGENFRQFRQIDLTRIGFGWVASVTVLLAMFLINDAADREIDKTVHPERPIPRGLSNWRHIYFLGCVFLLSGILFSLAVSQRCVEVAVAMAVLGIAHYGYTKNSLRIPGSSEVITPIMSALFPLYAFSVFELSDWRVIICSVMFIYFADFAQDLLGGIHDEEGDRRGNVRTFAIGFGSKTTLFVSVFSFLLANFAGLLLYRISSLGSTYLLVFLLLTFFMLAQYGRLFRIQNGADLRAAAGKVNHLGGGYFFLVSGSTFLDFIVRWLGSHD